MKRDTRINLVLTRDERAILDEMAAKRKRSLSDYLRWLFISDHEAEYKLTDEGRKALNEHREN